MHIVDILNLANDKTIIKNGLDNRNDYFRFKHSQNNFLRVSFGGGGPMQLQS